VGSGQVRSPLGYATFHVVASPQIATAQEVPRRQSYDAENVVMQDAEAEEDDVLPPILNFQLFGFMPNGRVGFLVLLSLMSVVAGEDSAVTTALAFQTYVWSSCLALITLGICYLLYAVAWNIVNMHKILLFVRREYLTGKKFVRSEYRSAKKELRKEFKEVRTALRKEFGTLKKAGKAYFAWQKQAHMINSIIGGVGTFVSIIGLFKSNEVTLAPMRTQGLRTTVNKGGMFVTGLLSLCLIFLAPIMGAERILKKLRPIIDLLKHLPYATWLSSWLYRWWNGDVDFDDLPQDGDELKEHLKGLNDEDEILEGLDEIAVARDKMEELKVKENKKLRKLASWVVTQESEELYLIKRISKKSTTPVSSDKLLEMFGVMWKSSPRPIIFGAFVFKDFEQFQAAIEKGHSPDSDHESEDEIDGSFIPNPYKPKKPAFVEKQKLASSTRTSTLSNPEDILDEVERDYFDDDDDHSDDVIALSLQSKEKHLEKEFEKADRKRGTGMFPGQGQSLNARDVQGLDLHPQSGGIGHWYERSVQQLGLFQAWFWNQFDLNPNHRPEGEIMDDTLMPEKETPAEMWSLLKHRYQQGRLWQHLKWRAKVTFNRHKRLSCIAIALGVIVVCYVTGAYKFAQEMSERQRAKARATHKSIAAKVKKPKAKELKPQKRGGRRTRAGKPKKFMQPSGGAEPANIPIYEVGYDQEEKDQENYYEPEEDTFGEEYEEYDEYEPRERYEDDDRRSDRVEGWDDDTRRRGGHDRRVENRIRVRGQAVELPPVESDAGLRRAIYNSKHRKVSCSSDELIKFISDAQAAYKTQMSEPLKMQAWNPSKLAAGVYKIFCGDRYLCTGTHVGNKLFVVVHSLSEDITKEYKAVNHVHTHKLLGKDIVLVNAEIAYFPLQNAASPFKAHNMKVMENASIVTVFGFGNGSSDQPDSIVGFASPLGWCNAPTRDGDCTSPVLDVNGNVVGFWTHGNGRDFGRFEPVTKAMKDVAARGVISHTGLDFQLAPHSL